MIANINVLGAALSLLVVAGYLWVSLRNDIESAQLNHVVILILSGVGIASGVNLGFVALLKDDVYLGQLVNQRIPILLGAIAVCWVSIDQVFKIFRIFNIKKFQENDN